MTGRMKTDKRFFHYGKRSIGYNLFFSHRKTLEIAVHPDRSLIIKAPLGADIPSIEKKLRKRAGWIVKQLNYFRQFNPKTPERRYVSGETHLYLGRRYRLKISHGSTDGVKLTHGFFQVVCGQEYGREAVKKLMDKWYFEKAGVQFHRSFDRCWSLFVSLDVPKPILLIKPMKKRWGGLSGKGAVTLNTELVKAPRECIDYVVTHELCHLKCHDHSREFYTFLETVLPDWKKIKHKLELGMA
jgi:predicted metal-dependent hydrolase